MSMYSRVTIRDNDQRSARNERSISPPRRQTARKSGGVVVGVLAPSSAPNEYTRRVTADNGGCALLISELGRLRAKARRLQEYMADHNHEIAITATEYNRLFNDIVGANDLMTWWRTEIYERVMDTRHEDDIEEQQHMNDTPPTAASTEEAPST